MKKIIRNFIYKYLMSSRPKDVKTKPDTAAPMGTKSFYDFTMKSINGKDINMAAYKGKKVILVNVASKCGYTLQYKELEELHQRYKDKVVILGFPADNFGGQEPGSNDEIAEFCEINFGVTFQLFEKSSVRGKDQNPLYYWLTHKEENGWNNEAPSWNFCKYLINEKGELVKFYSSSVPPLSEEITKELDVV